MSETKIVIYVPSGERGRNRDVALQKFADALKNIQKQIDFKMSSRGWAYFLENLEVYLPSGDRFTKGHFNKVEDTIVTCRKRGFLPIDFTVSDKRRAFEGVEIPSSSSPVRSFKSILRTVVENIYYTPNYWEGESYYIQMAVEKADLVSLFKPICQQFHIPIANMVGWSDLNSRFKMLRRFAKAQELGLEPKLLYYGDLDPYGNAISDFLRDNFNSMSEATGWYAPSDLVDRFGLNLDFVIANDLTWVDNLISGSGNQLNSPKL